MDNKDITHGTGNVYADLGFPDATERQTKTRLAFTINEHQDVEIMIRPWANNAEAGHISVLAVQ